MTEKNNRKETPIKDVRGVRSFHLEADRTLSGMSVILSGIIGISDFSDSLVYLQSHGGRIIVNGSGLLICVLDGGSVEIVGRVEGISFKYGKN